MIGLRAFARAGAVVPRIVILEAKSLRARSVRHGFSTRPGGVSEGPYASLNLSTRVGDDPVRVAENRSRLEQASGLSLERLVDLDQVHGTAALVVLDAWAPGARPEADISLTARSDVVLGVRTADCAPILLWCDAPRAAAAVHAGWRGTLAGVAGRAVQALEEHFGCPPSRVLSAIGPCLGRDHFEVGPEVYKPFRDRFGPEVVLDGASGLRIDLAAANRLSLREAGVEQIEVLGQCTFEAAELFYSHRRDRGLTGRHLSWISLG